MEFELTPDIENIAKAAVLAGDYESVDAFVREAVREAVREKAEEVASAVSKSRMDNTDDWLKKLYAIGARHKATGYPVDDSRESIYPESIIMRILCDTNILLRAVSQDSSDHAVALECLATLRTHGETPVLVPQCIYEFYVVATRPVKQNGLGASPDDAMSFIEDFGNYAGPSR